MSSNFSLSLREYLYLVSCDNVACYILISWFKDLPFPCNRWYYWNTLSLQMHFRQISHATLLHCTWRVDIHIRWALVVLSHSRRSPCALSSGSQCCSNEICWCWWVTGSCSYTSRLANRSLISFSGVTKWGNSSSYRYQNFLRTLSHENDYVSPYSDLVLPFSSLSLFPLFPDRRVILSFSGFGNEQSWGVTRPCA